MPEAHAASPVPSDVGGEKRHALSQWKRGRFALSKRQLILVVALAASVVTIALALGLGLGLGLHHSIESTPENPVVDLGYARYQGSNSSGVAQWLGMRYAAAPTGNLRFAAPEPPTRQSGTQPASRHGSKCLAVRTSSTNKTSPGQSEDCLFIGVYAPANATTESRLPVYVYLQGGGFIQNAGAYNGAPLVKASGMQIVVVDLNYRVGPYGFLASDEIQRGGSLNNGLKDQRQALHWIKDHISRFGGNPDHVVLGGSSAGAASITLQLVAYGGRNDSLFHATAAESQSFGAIRTISESQYQYDELVARTGCDRPNTDTLSCLRALSTSELQAQNIGTPFPNTTLRPLFAYNPTLDNDFIPDHTLTLFSTGLFQKLPAIYGDVTNEGTVFVPRNLSTPTESNNWIQAQFPLLNTTQEEYLTDTYHPTTQTYPNTAAYWSPTSSSYGELRYICPGIFLSNIYASQNIARNYNYRYAVLDPANNRSGLGTPHVAELNAIWGAPGGSPASYRLGGTNANMIAVLQGYWISFIRTFDPNVFRASGTPLWEEWGVRSFGEEEGGRRILFQNDGGRRTEMEKVDGGQWERCGRLTQWGVALGQ